MTTRTLVFIVTACAVAVAFLAMIGAPVYLAAPVAIIASSCAVLATPRLLRRPVETVEA